MGNAAMYDEVTNRLIAALEAGVAPWRQPWTMTTTPTSLSTGKAYRGINSLLLWLDQQDGDNYGNLWGTFNQIKAKGGRVNKGSHGTKIVFWKPLIIRERDNTGAEVKRTIPMMQHYTVFNIEGQTTGIKTAKDERQPVPVIEACEAVIKGMPNAPTIEHTGDSAHYSPSADTVTMPPRDSFNSPERYYHVMFHELAHATGHHSRLGRRDINTVRPFGSEDYGKEELVAEMASAMVCGVVGLNGIETPSAAYLASWIKTLKGDNRLAISAASAAQKAADWIMGVNYKAPTEAVEAL
jgi:antirestriction protein ArdC